MLVQVRLDRKIFQVSLAVEQATVNHFVNGSIPLLGVLSKEKRFMKFSKNKINSVLHIYARYYGRDTEIKICVISAYEQPTHLNLDIDEAKELHIFLSEAIEDAEKRKLMPERDDD